MKGTSDEWRMGVMKRGRAKERGDLRGKTNEKKIKIAETFARYVSFIVTLTSLINCIPKE